MNQSKEQIKFKVIEVLKDFIGTAYDYTDTTRFIEDLDFDNLDFIELSILCEVEFDIEIPDEWMDKVKTIEEFVTAIKDTLDMLEATKETTPEGKRDESERSQS